MGKKQRELPPVNKVELDELKQLITATMEATPGGEMTIANLGAHLRWKDRKRRLGPFLAFINKHAPQIRIKRKPDGRNTVCLISSESNQFPDTLEGAFYLIVETLINESGSTTLANLGGKLHWPMVAKKRFGSLLNVLSKYDDLIAVRSEGQDKHFVELNEHWAEENLSTEKDLLEIWNSRKYRTGSIIVEYFKKKSNEFGLSIDFDAETVEYEYRPLKIDDDNINDGNGNGLRNNILRSSFDLVSNGSSSFSSLSLGSGNSSVGTTTGHIGHITTSTATTGGNNNNNIGIGANTMAAALNSFPSVSNNTTSTSLSFSELLNGRSGSSNNGSLRGSSNGSLNSMNSVFDDLSLEEAIAHDNINANHYDMPISGSTSNVKQQPNIDIGLVQQLDQHLRQQQMSQKPLSSVKMSPKQQYYHQQQRTQSNNLFGNLEVPTSMATPFIPSEDKNYSRHIPIIKNRFGLENEIASQLGLRPPQHTQHTQQQLQQKKDIIGQQGNGSGNSAMPMDIHQTAMMMPGSNAVFNNSNNSIPQAQVHHHNHNVATTTAGMSHTHTMNASVNASAANPEMMSNLLTILRKSVGGSPPMNPLSSTSPSPVVRPQQQPSQQQQQQQQHRSSISDVQNGNLLAALNAQQQQLQEQLMAHQRMQQQQRQQQQQQQQQLYEQQKTQQLQNLLNEMAQHNARPIPHQAPARQCIPHQPSTLPPQMNPSLQMNYQHTHNPQVGGYIGQHHQFHQQQQQVPQHMLHQYHRQQQQQQQQQQNSHGQQQNSHEQQRTRAPSRDLNEFFASLAQQKDQQTAHIKKQVSFNPTVTQLGNVKKTETNMNANSEPFFPREHEPQPQQPQQQQQNVTATSSSLYSIDNSNNNSSRGMMMMAMSNGGMSKSKMMGNAAPQTNNQHHHQTVSSLSSTSTNSVAADGYSSGSHFGGRPLVGVGMNTGSSSSSMLIPSFSSSSTTSIPAHGNGRTKLETLSELAASMMNGSNQY